MSVFGGPRGDNPFVVGTGDSTPYIADLPSGAALFGLTGLTTSAPDFNAVLYSAPSDAVGALYRMDMGPVGYSDEYTGFDILAFLNLTNVGLLNPMLGIDPGGLDHLFLTPLLSAGYATDPTFGGFGPTVLIALAPHGVYLTLVPEGSAIFNASVSDAQGIVGTGLSNGSFAYLLHPSTAPVPEPGSLQLAGFTVVVIISVKTRWRKVFAHHRSAPSPGRLPVLGLVGHRSDATECPRQAKVV